MASSYTANIGIEKPGSGEQAGTWGTTTNTNFDIIDRAINGVLSLSLTGTTTTLTTTDGSLSDAGHKVLVLAGSPSGTNTITIDPNDQDKVYLVKNGSGQTATFTQGSGGNASVSDGETAWIFADGAGSGAQVQKAVFDIVNDTSPQLGGNLDVNAKNIVFGDSSGSSDDRLTFGAGTDLSIYHDGTDNHVDVAGTLTIDGSGETLAKFIDDGAVELYHNNTKRIETDSAGVTVTGQITITGSSIVLEGATSDAHETTLTVTDPTADRTITFPNSSGTVALTSDVSASLPSGTVVPFAGSSAPTGYLLAQGQAVSRSTYSDLFSAIGTTYGSGDGSSTFNLPDLRGRVVAGKDDMGGSSANRLTDQTGGLNGDTLGDTGGSETHTLTEAQLAAHTHGAGSYTALFPGDGTQSTAGGTGNRGTQGGSNLTVSGTSGSTGSGSAHNNVQPTIILNYIIKT
jgi:microcystin-dependent protein